MPDLHIASWHHCFIGSACGRDRHHEYHAGLGHRAHTGDSGFDWPSVLQKKTFSFSFLAEAVAIANMLVHSHLRPAAVKAGVIPKDWEGRFGFHNFRHSLASYLVRSKTDPKTVQALLRHSDVKTTLQLYSHSLTEDRMLAQGTVLEAILGSGTDKSGLRAD